jgi:hypothetical protein
LVSIAMAGTASRRTKQIATTADKYFFIFFSSLMNNH